MSALEVIEDANKSAGIDTFVFADLKEFNAFIASFDNLDYPANIIVPFDSTGTWVSGRRKGVIPLRGWILTPLEEDPNNYRSAKIESSYMQPMRALAIKFLKHVINSDITDAEVQTLSDRIVPEYGFLNNTSRKLFGVSYTLNWAIVENVC